MRFTSNTYTSGFVLVQKFHHGYFRNRNLQRLVLPVVVIIPNPLRLACFIERVVVLCLLLCCLNKEFHDIVEPKTFIHWLRWKGLPHHCWMGSFEKHSVWSVIPLNHTMNLIQPKNETRSFRLRLNTDSVLL